jgi:3,4-dihydroxy 2-butanone 4-phosphate synthase/GTP cyclohydrolase II
VATVPYEQWLAGAEAHRKQYNRPRVTLAYAQSLDGSITTRRGFPQALSGQASLGLTHQLRAAHAALLIGIGTVLADNPRLTVRLVEGKDPQPVILDAHLRFPPHANLLHHPSPPWIATSEEADTHKAAALEAAGARLLRLPCQSAGEIDLDILLERLAAMGINSLMVEGGARVITAFLRQRLVDQVVITLAAVFVGGLHAVEEPLGQDGGRADLTPVSHLAFPRLKSMGFGQWGEDLVIWGEMA